MTPLIPQPDRRRRLLASVMTVPAFLAALGMCAVESWRLVRPQSSLFAAPFVYSLADAIERNDVEHAHAFLRAGQDPNRPIAVRHAVLTGGQSVLVPPLVWAVETGSRETLLMLLGFGARVDPTNPDNALCAAEALGSKELARLLTVYGSAICPPPPPTAGSADAAVPRRAPPSTPARPASPAPTR
jgi:hypothetical protein